VKVFLDTSVLIATFYTQHEYHRASIKLFLSLKRGDGYCGSHSLAEIYSVLTGRSGKERITGNEAMLFIGDVNERLAQVSLTGLEFLEALRAAAALRLAGGAIHDAILGHCALKSEAEAIYTWNQKDFIRLGTEIAHRVKTPNN
jgi:predicted nucleic acid-binding protein